jgi:hypothetical protein
MEQQLQVGVHMRTSASVLDNERPSPDRGAAGGKRVLYVAYLFPPVGGAGVQRTTKFVKYLPQFGWHPSVLTVANPSVPLLDGCLAADVPAGTLVRRARTWEPSYALKGVVAAGADPARGRSLGRLAKGLVRRLAGLVLQPDPQVLWLPSALREGRRLLRGLRHEAIVATAPPFSSFLVGAALARQTGLPLVLDYRDEWLLCSAYGENRCRNPVTRRVQGVMQRRAVRAAGALVATTRRSAAALEQVRDEAGGTARVACIYNGFDPDDFPPGPPAAPGAGRYRLAYVGTLWNLTSVAPLVRAVEHLARTRPALVRRLELVFAGRRTAEQQQLLEALKPLPCRVVEHPYVDHRGAVELLAAADGLCLLLSDVPGAERVVPAKLFEYVAARRPILAVAPRGEVWDLLAPHPAARLFRPADVEGIAAHLEAELGRDQTGPAPEWAPPGFDRRSQAGQLAQVLDALHAAAARPA